MRATYDCVIVGSSSARTYRQRPRNTPLIDRSFLVLEWGRTTTDVVQHALHAAPNVYEAVVGTMLNKTDYEDNETSRRLHGDYLQQEALHPLPANGRMMLDRNLPG